jgi:hypothetical protein
MHKGLIKVFTRMKLFTCANIGFYFLFVRSFFFLANTFLSQKLKGGYLGIIGAHIDAEMCVPPLQPLFVGRPTARSRLM